MRSYLITFALILICHALPGILPDELEFFEKKIRPILAETCYDCHNSVNKTEAGLALDWREGLLAGSDQGSVVEPGNPDNSALIWAIRHQDGFDMPDNGPKLEDHVIANFEEWVLMGAPDPRDRKPTQLDLDNAIDWETLLENRSQWWSFQPLKKTRPPKSENPDWNETAIDQFVYAYMKEQGLEPQVLADPETLVRRLHLVLTGLPPKAEVVKAFVANPSEMAYEAMVSDLLASKAYGERWGRYWMDWYRFAETHGSEGDPVIPFVGIYRDYIIRALNEDVPYDDLLVEHIAGDLIKRPRINEELEINESAIGPAHYRMVPYGFGVVDAYQEQINYTDNQIDVISKAMMGVTVSCARCHNHKFDPISQKDFYRFYGIMISNRPGTRNVDIKEKQELNKGAMARLKAKIQRGMADYWMEHVDVAVERLASFSFAPTEEEQEIFDDLKKERRKRKKELPTDPQALNDFNLKREVNTIGDYHPLAPVKLWLEKPADEISRAWKEQLKAHAADLKGFEEAKKDATYYADLRDQKTLESWFMEGNGVSAKVSPSGSFAVAGKGFYAISEIFPRGVYSNLFSNKHNGTLQSPYHEAKGDWSFMRAAGFNGAIRMSARSYPLEQGLHPYEYADTGFLQWFPLAKYKFWNEEQVYYQISTAGDKPTKFKEEPSWFGVTEVIGGKVEMKELGLPLYTVLKDDVSVTDRESLLNAYQKALKQSIASWRRNRISDVQAEFLSVFVRFNFLPNQFEILPEKLGKLFAYYRDLENDIPIPTRAPAFIEGDVIDQPLLVRGEHHNPDELVPRQFLEVFANKHYTGENSGRLELAQDIIGKNNTLKSRVLVNRLWHYVFGRGIVLTTDNFGRLGQKPTHPDLLDYLALDFEKRGWSIKTALKQLVSSRTFRSVSLAPDEVIEKDPENLYLSYYTPRRLDAEAIMDSINSMARVEFKRGVYAYVKRNKLDPFLTTFNLPIPITTVSRRDSTNVPAQALSMMNGEFVQEAAKEWGEKVQARLGDAPAKAKIEALFWDAYARVPSAEESDQLVEYYGSIENSNTAMQNIAFALMNTKEFIYVH